MWAVLVCSQIFGGFWDPRQAWMRAWVEMVLDSRISFLLAAVLRQLTVRPVRLMRAKALVREAGQFPVVDLASQWMCWGVVGVAGWSGPRVRMIGVKFFSIRNEQRAWPRKPLPPG